MSAVECPRLGCGGTLRTRHYVTGPGRGGGQRLSTVVCDNAQCTFDRRRPRYPEDGATSLNPRGDT